MTEAAPAEQAVEAEKKKRLFHRIPTSLLVTLIGIALTAWLLPAFTRQWDDRQKAHELKAALAARRPVVSPAVSFGETVRSSGPRRSGSRRSDFGET